MRKYLGLLLFFSLIILGFSGIVLYIIPHGRVAYWTFWSFLGLQKQDWEAVHTIFGFLFIILSIWHIGLNWRVIKNYILKKAVLFFSKEFWITAGITTAIFTFTLLNVPPCSTIIDLGEKIKDYWGTRLPNPPFPHMELFSLNKVAKFVNLSGEEALKILKQEGLKVGSPHESLREIALKNHTSPAKIYAILLNKIKKNSEKILPATGWGRRTVKEVCKEFGISLDNCLEKLQKTSLKEAASSAGCTPYELVKRLNLSSKP